MSTAGTMIECGERQGVQINFRVATLLYISILHHFIRASVILFSLILSWGK